MITYPIMQMQNVCGLVCLIFERVSLLTLLRHECQGILLLTWIFAI
ncbi:MAG TPA: hypothetical protein VFU49_00165 [Ktedonobacteraceae bacterium]|nr:hypothetical protein [Ktedonobacteraceae bacterium]